MKKEKTLLRVALLGNPNSGKTSMFNRLTGLNNKVGNFPGVTVARHSGFFEHEGHRIECIDFPGTYSLYPRSLDDSIVVRELMQKEHSFDLVVVVLNSVELKRSISLLTQVKDLGIRCVGALNMIDEAEQQQCIIDAPRLSKRLDIPLECTDARRGRGFLALKNAVVKSASLPIHGKHKPLGKENGGHNDPSTQKMETLLEKVKKTFRLQKNYAAFQYLQQDVDYLPLNSEEKKHLEEWQTQDTQWLEKQKEKEIESRFLEIEKMLQGVLSSPPKTGGWSERLDRLFTHRIWGSLIFLGLLFFVFQLLFHMAAPLMDGIDAGFAMLSTRIGEWLPEGLITQLLVEGIIPGIAGVVIFVPQIAFLFMVLSLLEESGYMARVITLSDRYMRKVGLNGRSVLPLVSGMACAIPSIMAARTIPSAKQRLLTILVVPLMSCSARLPVYTLLIALMVPTQVTWGIFNLQGILLFSMYLLGIAATLACAWVFHLVLKKQKHKDYLFMEMPKYRIPLWRNVGLTTYQKSSLFIFNAGKVILAIAIILWALASFGGQAAYEQEAQEQRAYYSQQGKSPEEIAQELSGLRLKHSYIGQWGEALEPLIAPLGYDWKIGIGLIASFAAREVFVSTLLIIYSIDNEADEEKIRDKLQKETHADGSAVYSIATCASLLIFYAFAMQCMSTFAITYKETKRWRWAFFQLAYTNVLAYLGAWGVYELLR